MAVTFRGEYATRSVVLVHETRTNQEGFRDAREGLSGYSQRRSDEIHSPWAGDEKPQVLLLQRAKAKGVQLLQMACPLEVGDGDQRPAISTCDPSR